MKHCADGAITYSGSKMAHGLSASFDLAQRPETEDVYSDVSMSARKFDIELTKLPYYPR